MKKHLLFFALLISIAGAKAQDTFSIVAVDSVTKEVGSAGASCIGSCIIISDIIPGRGGIHTQALYDVNNKNNAHSRMVAGDSPQQIINYMKANDVTASPSVRQYGVVDFDSSGHPRSASFTGDSCMDYKNHITGRYYSIQGNILIGQHVLDSMQSRFLRTSGTLADKLMAALQGAKIPGADSRCLSKGISSLSTFLRVADQTDTPGSFKLDLNVPSAGFGNEPIDSLQILYNHYKNPTGINKQINNFGITIIKNVNGSFTVDFSKSQKPLKISVSDIAGRLIYSQTISSSVILPRETFPNKGIFLLTISNETGNIEAKKIIVD